MTAVDIVLCVDVTASMTSIIETVKKGALGFHEQLAEAMAERDMDISRLRVKVLAFRDFSVDRDVIEQTDFLQLPGDKNRLAAFMARLKATGGGDVPESGLEALALAIRSPWSTGDGDLRKIIVMFTDASAHPLGHRKSVRARGYPESVPRSLDGLQDLWQGDDSPMGVGAKRLVLFTPEIGPWDEIADTWDKTVLVPSVAGTGLADVVMDEVIATLVRSM
ncbi:vWA domain-containing protein [Actinocrispum wychmicini]|uniref:von Willebrand factor type A domain-containing protein n=1 Tax=Actinocrispum wychmicini TaxID=1213861 RepID=A0A4R2JSC2_9PSEU|nr:vWA domain-containing protein [Actinocrispum wychmicini]TCO57075.1 von Willebrand factor type A domain-containing protein [Actinocrispum wychmicini]